MLHLHYICYCVNSADVPQLLFPEAEMVMEEETLPKIVEVTEKSESEKMSEYSDYLRTNPNKATKTLYEGELEQSAVAESADDKQFVKFKARLAASPDQVSVVDGTWASYTFKQMHRPTNMAALN